MLSRFDFIISFLLLNRWGGNIGSLQISAVQNTPDGQEDLLLWQRNESLPREWRTGHINLRDSPYDYALRIDGFVGNGYEGDVCLMLFSLLRKI